MKHLVFGIVVLLFGIFIGGVWVASAGLGIGLPMIPIGIYFTYRGWRIFKHERQNLDIINPEPLKPLEKTKIGKISIGVLFILVGVKTSAMIIGIPILLAGVWFIYDAFKIQIKKALMGT